MASRILTRFAGLRNYSTVQGSSAVAGDHGGGSKTWKWLSFLVALPAVAVCFINAELKEKEHREHGHRPEFHPYEHLRLRSKPFPWGDGNRSLFHDDKVTPLPDGYVDEEE